jgi:hypothetical protein
MSTKRLKRRANRPEPKNAERLSLALWSVEQVLKGVPGIRKES